MPLADAHEFLNRYRADDALRQQLDEASSDEERKSLIGALGLSFTRAELDQAIRDNPRQLTDAELASIAGGLADGTATVRYLA